MLHWAPHKAILFEKQTRYCLSTNKDCVLLLDEIQLKRKIEYDAGLKIMTENVSREFVQAKGPDEEAAHALVFMVKGLCIPYKQTVA
jgi:hypothetical protein